LHRCRTAGLHSIDTIPNFAGDFIGDTTVTLKAGAANREDTFKLADCLSKVTVIEPEPAPKTMDTYTKRTSYLQNVIRYQAVFSVVSGAQQLKSSGGTAFGAIDSSSLLKPSLHKASSPQRGNHDWTLIGNQEPVFSGFNISKGELLQLSYLSA